METIDLVKQFFCRTEMYDYVLNVTECSRSGRVSEKAVYVFCVSIDKIHVQIEGPLVGKRKTYNWLTVFLGTVVHGHAYIHTTAIRMY